MELSLLIPNPLQKPPRNRFFYRFQSLLEYGSSRYMYWYLGTCTSTVPSFSDKGSIELHVQRKFCA